MNKINSVLTKIKGFFLLLKTPKQFIIRLVRSLSSVIPERIYLCILYRLYLGKKLNLNSPKLFNEKLQWLKLYNRKPEYHKMVDKIEVKKYVESVLGKDYIIPTIAVFDNVDSIDFSILPNEFVLKTSHGSGSAGVVICKDVNLLNKREACKKLYRSMCYDSYKSLIEWPYKGISKRVFAEKLMKDEENQDLLDYKFYCFNGEPYYCQIIANRSTSETIDFYDKNWKHQEFSGLSTHNMAGDVFPKPLKYEEMLDVARKLSSNIPFVRVDLFYINQRIYFGEITFFPSSGFGFFKPDCWNKKLGDMLVLK